MLKAAKMLVKAMEKTNTKFSNIFFIILEILYMANVFVKQGGVDVAHMLLPVCISRLIF